MSDHALHLGDCIEGLAGLASKSVDHVITDPPYSRDLYSRTRTNAGRGVRSDTGRRACPVKDNHGAIVLASMAIGAIDDILEPAAEEIKRVAARWVIVFSDFEIAPRWRDAFGDWYVRTGVWVKTDPMPQVSGDRPAQGFETATIAHRPGRKRWNGGGRPAVWIYGTAKGVERGDHPCPKPLDLMQHLISDFTDPGELICDPFAGSATTGVAAWRLGRRFVGWERDPVFHAAAVRRLEAAQQQYELLPRPPKAKQTRLLP